jgi:hypothetical protein
LSPATGGGLSPCAAAGVVRQASAVAPAATKKPSTSTTATAALSLLIDMAPSTPSVRAAASAEIAPAAACRPAATRVAALIVCDTTETGTAADATFCANVAANAPPDRTTPRRASRFASTALALVSRPANVPSGQPRWRAASLRVRPSRSHSTTAAR